MEIKNTILNKYRAANFIEHHIASLINLIKNIPVMNQVWRERQELALMTKDHLLDIGLDPIKVQQECMRTYFDIPEERKKPASRFRLTGSRSSTEACLKQF